MGAQWIFLLALFIVVLASRQERVNVGVLALAMAGMIGIYKSIDAVDLFGSFPLSLFVILFGVTFFFGLAQVNGTLEKIAHLMIRFARGKVTNLPVVFFVLPLLLAAIGPGNIGAIALLAPLALSIAGRTGISAFFMTLMLINGANAGTFSPFSPTGIIANGAIANLGLTMNPWTQVFLPSLLAQSFIALVCYAVLITRMRGQPVAADFNADRRLQVRDPFSRQQIITIFAVAILIVGVIFFKADVGWMAIFLAVLLILGRISDAKAAVAVVPWNVIVMVCGVSTLIGVMGKTGGLGLFTDFLAKISTPGNVTGVLALVAGVISSYSSSSGVVMPALIPMVPGLIEKIGGGYPQALIASINVGSHVVDVSPLSTLGALCIASAPNHEHKNRLFNQLLVYGLSMSLFGALVCYVFFGWLGKWVLG